MFVIIIVNKNYILSLIIIINITLQDNLINIYHIIFLRLQIEIFRIGLKSQLEYCIILLDYFVGI